MFFGILQHLHHVKTGENQNYENIFDNKVFNLSAIFRMQASSDVVIQYKLYEFSFGLQSIIRNKSRTEQKAHCKQILIKQT